MRGSVGYVAARGDLAEPHGCATLEIFLQFTETLNVQEIITVN